jgi:predicted HTH transcriptional regulator
MTYPKEYLLRLLKELRLLPKETEWVEFKHNNADPQEIGEYISALANSATLAGKAHGYLVWGIEANTHNVVGTSFNPKGQKIGNEEMENWLLRLLSPKINFYFHTFQTEHGGVVII